MDMVKNLRKVRRAVAGFSLATLIASFFAISVAQAQTFPDVPTNEWFYEPVENLVQLGIVNGDMPNYRPGDYVNRAEMAKLVVEAFELTIEEPATPTFKDVPKCDTDACWFYKYVETAAKHGVVNGYRDTVGNLTGYYGPGDNVTREQVAKMITLGKPLVENTSCGQIFPDVNVTSEMYKYVSTLYAWSIVDGYKDGTYGPTTNINRAEIAKVMSNSLDPVLRSCGGFNVESATALSETTVEVCYSQDYDETSAMMPENYAIEDADGNALAVSEVEASSDSMCVVLTTEAQTPGKNYDVTVTDVASADDMDIGAGMASFTGYSMMTTGGDLSVELSGDTPVGVTLPGSVSGVELFKFVVGATDEDVVLTSFEIHRGGTGTDNSLTDIAIFDENSRVSKAKTFNSSTDTATVNLLSGGVTVEANKTKTFTVIGTVGAINSGEFYLELVNADAVTSNASSVDGTFPVKGETFTVGATAGSAITWLDDGKPADPKLGALQADVSKFRLRNESSDDAIELNGLTLYSTGTVKADTEMENYSLYVDGDLVAETESAYNKYITFNLVEPVSIGSSKTVNVVVKADIIGGASQTIAFKLDNVLDLQATDTNFGYGAKVDYITGAGTGTTYEAETLTVQAGEVAIVSTDADSTDILKNKKNIVAGSFKVTVKEGLNLELQKFRVNLTNEEASAVSGPAGCAANPTYDSALGCLVENVELYDKKTGSVYDLTAVTGGTEIKTDVYADTNLTIPMSSGETREFDIRFDTLNRTIDTAKLVFAIQNIGNTAGGIYMVETGDDKAVTDITPSSITYKTLNGVAATATVDTISLSATKNAVIGDTEVEVHEFVIGAGNASPLSLSEVKLDGQTMAMQSLVVGAVPGNAETVTIGTCVVTFSGAANDLNCAGGANIKRDDVGESATTIANDLRALTGASDAVQGALVFGGTGTTVTVAGTNYAAAASNVTFTDGTGGDITNTATAVGDVSNAIVSALRLYKVDGDTKTLLKEKSGSTLAAGVVTFDGLSEVIDLNESNRYLVTVDMVNDASKDDYRFRFALTSLNLDDQDSDDVTTGTVNGNAGTSLTTIPTTLAGGLSTRTVTIQGVGSLTLTEDNTDTETNRAKNILGGTTSGFVASYEFVAVNEPVIVKDLQFVDGTGNLANAVSEIVLYGNDKTTEIARKTVSNATVTFTNMNYEVAEGSQNMYVKVVARKIGKDEVTDRYADMTLTAQVTQADGKNSNKSLTTAASGASLGFSTVATKISNLAFVDTATVSGTTVNVPTSLTVGENVFAILAVSTDPSTNTRLDNGAEVKTALTQFIFSVLSDIDDTGDQVDTNTITVERIGGSGDYTFATTHAAFAAGTNVVTTTMGSADSANAEIANGSVAYFAIKGPVDGLSSTNNKYVQVKFTSLNDGDEIRYNTDEAGTTLAAVQALRLASPTLDAPKVASNY